MSTYVKHLNDATKESQSLHKKITGDYLVIRHNSKVAQDILLKKQMEANLVMTTTMMQRVCSYIS